LKKQPFALKISIQHMNLENLQSHHSPAQFKRRWFSLSGLGLGLTGAGLSVVGYAAQMMGPAPVPIWFCWGLTGLILFNAGLACLGEAVKYRTFLELAWAGSAGHSRSSDPEKE
jgi:hypothetical protein